MHYEVHNADEDYNSTIDSFKDSDSFGFGHWNGYLDCEKLIFKEDGVYLVELIYLPWKANGRHYYQFPYGESKYAANLRFNDNLYIENGEYIIKNKKYPNSFLEAINGDYDNSGILRENINTALCILEVRNKKLNRLTNEIEPTNLKLNIKQLKTNNSNITFGALKYADNVKWHNHNRGGYYEEAYFGTIGNPEMLFKILDNSLRIIFFKFCQYHDGYAKYNDWLWIRLAAIGIYKIGD